MEMWADKTQPIHDDRCIEALCNHCNVMREKNMLYLVIMYLFRHFRKSRSPPPTSSAVLSRNGVNKWTATIRPFIQVQRKTDLLCLRFVSGCWFKRGGEKVRTRSLFTLGFSNDVRTVPAYACQLKLTTNTSTTNNSPPPSLPSKVPSGLCDPQKRARPLLLDPPLPRRLV